MPELRDEQLNWDDDYKSTPFRGCLLGLAIVMLFFWIPLAWFMWHWLVH